MCYYWIFDLQITDPSKFRQLTLYYTFIVKAEKNFSSNFEFAKLYLVMIQQAINLEYSFLRNFSQVAS